MWNTESFSFKILYINCIWLHVIYFLGYLFIGIHLIIIQNVVFNDLILIVYFKHYVSYLIKILPIFYCRTLNLFKYFKSLIYVYFTHLLLSPLVLTVLVPVKKINRKSLVRRALLQILWGSCNLHLWWYIYQKSLTNSPFISFAFTPCPIGSEPTVLSAHLFYIHKHTESCSFNETSLHSLCLIQLQV